MSESLKGRCFIHLNTMCICLRTEKEQKSTRTPHQWLSSQRASFCRVSKRMITRTRHRCVLGLCMCVCVCVCDFEGILLITCSPARDRGPPPPPPDTHTHTHARTHARTHTHTYTHTHTRSKLPQSASCRRRVWWNFTSLVSVLACVRVCVLLHVCGLLDAVYVGFLCVVKGC